MKRLLFLLSALCITLFSSAQKKPLDHSVYDGWQRIGERLISNDGKWVVYTIELQEGDNELIIQSADNNYRKSIARGYNATITEDNRFVIFKIKPFYKDTRDAKIKKKKADDFPKDSLGILELGKDEVWKSQRVKSFKIPQKAAGWLAYNLEKMPEPATVPKTKMIETPVNHKIADSLNHIIDSLQMVIEKMPEPTKKIKTKNKNKDDEELTSLEDVSDADGDESSAGTTELGTDLVLRNMSSGQEKTFKNVLEYYFSKGGEKLLMEESRNPKDSLSKACILLVDLRLSRTDTLSRGGNDFRNFALTDDGSKCAWVAERDAKPKELQKFYRLWYYKNGMDSAALLADRFSVGMKLGMTVSENGTLSFSKSGNRLFFGTAPVQPAKDTTLVDFEHPKVDIWNYKDDYLQTVQLFRLQNDLKENFLAVYNLENGTIHQLGSREIPQIIQTGEGDGNTFIGVTDFGKRVESQWTGNTKKDIYAIDMNTGKEKKIKEDLLGQAYASSKGDYILWYDRMAKNYFVWDGKTAKNLTDKIKVPLWNEAAEVPEEPNSYGVMGWEQGDVAVYIYDKYDIWKLDPAGKTAPENIFEGSGRTEKMTYRYVRTDPDETYLPIGKELLLRSFNNVTKTAGLNFLVLGKPNAVKISAMPFENQAYIYSNPIKAKTALTYVYTKESFKESPDIYVDNEMKSEKRLSSINSQQTEYNWGTSELFNWKTFSGKDATGILYKPEDYNPHKKYPLICYFYETLSDNLNAYHPPAPIRSAINISFFVSRGYVILLPDIHYGTGHPGKDAYDYIVSGAQALVKKGIADKDNLALQGHSWGGYQTAQVITMTNIFKAAWAGAPVVNMTSAYGGIRWESGVNRQFQYEKSQSRIGATLWEKPQLYIENSPLFHLDKVTTPLVIMANDNDGAVPWYQGIEFFTAMRRLGKKIWMFNYNGEGHGLTQRQDMRDYAIRMQQWFDWMLKGEKPAKWITDGLPAVKKGKEWGLEF